VDLSGLVSFVELAKDHPVLAALVLGVVALFLWWRFGNPLTVDLRGTAIWRDGFYVRRIRIHNPSKVTTIDGVTVRLDLCEQQPTHTIKLLRDNLGEHPFSIDPGEEVYIRVIAQTTTDPEFVFCYDPSEGEPNKIRKRRLDLEIGVTARRRIKKRWKFSASEDGSGYLDLYEPRLPRSAEPQRQPPVHEPERPFSHTSGDVIIRRLKSLSPGDAARVDEWAAHRVSTTRLAGYPKELPFQILVPVQVSGEPPMTIAFLLKEGVSYGANVDSVVPDGAGGSFAVSLRPASEFETFSNRDELPVTLGAPGHKSVRIKKIKFEP
jgi:hypothetical protein